MWTMAEAGGDVAAIGCWVEVVTWPVNYLHLYLPGPWVIVNVHVTY